MRDVDGGTFGVAGGDRAAKVLPRLRDGSASTDGIRVSKSAIDCMLSQIRRLVERYDVLSVARGRMPRKQEL